MTRSSSTLILILALLGAAVAAVPAAASDGYQSLIAITGDDSGGQSQSQPNDYTAVNAALGPESRDSLSAASATGDPSSVNAVLATPDGHPASSGPGNGSRSLTSIVGSDGLPHQSPPPAVEVRDDDGFGWFDALIGALIASGLTLITLAAARSVARHRRATAESRA